eukprot:145816_1
MSSALLKWIEENKLQKVSDTIIEYQVTLQELATLTDNELQSFANPFKNLPHGIILYKRFIGAVKELRVKDDFKLNNTCITQQLQSKHNDITMLNQFINQRLRDLKNVKYKQCQEKINRAFESLNDRLIQRKEALSNKLNTVYKTKLNRLTEQLKINETLQADILNVQNQNDKICKLMLDELNKHNLDESCVEDTNILILFDKLIVNKMSTLYNQYGDIACYTAPTITVTKINCHFAEIKISSQEPNIHSKITQYEIKYLVDPTDNAIDDIKNNESIVILSNSHIYQLKDLKQNQKYLISARYKIENIDTNHNFCWSLFCEQTAVQTLKFPKFVFNQRKYGKRVVIESETKVLAGHEHRGAAAVDIVIDGSRFKSFAWKYVIHRFEHYSWFDKIKPHHFCIGTGMLNDVGVKTYSRNEYPKQTAGGLKNTVQVNDCFLFKVHFDEMKCYVYHNNDLIGNSWCWQNISKKIVPVFSCGDASIEIVACEYR